MKERRERREGGLKVSYVVRVAIRGKECEYGRRVLALVMTLLTQDKFLPITKLGNHIPSLSGTMSKVPLLDYVIIIIKGVVTWFKTHEIYKSHNNRH